MTRVTDDVMLIAAQSLAAQVTKADLQTGCVYPPLSSIREVSLKIAVAVADYVRLINSHQLTPNLFQAYMNGFTTVPKPENLEDHCRSIMYCP